MTEQAKSSAPAQEHPYPQPTIVPFPPQAYNGAPYPPPGPPGTYMPPFFAYPPHPDGTHPEGAPNGVPPGSFMIGLPPGVVYAYPPHPTPQPFGAPPANPAPPALSRPKRKQVKMACTNCAGACKRCDENRPCERCVKYGVADTCVDGQRKERKKGIKRGPYRRKNKNESDSNSFNGEWTPPSSSTTAAAIHAVAQYAPPEGYYPVYYPPPPGFMSHPPPPPPDGSSSSTPNPNPDGSPSAHPANGQPPMMPYYIHHPGAYPPFPHYPPMYAGPPPPGAPHPQAQAAPVTVPAPQTAAPEQQPQTLNPVDASGKPDEMSVSANGAAAPAENGAVANGAGKKRPRTGKNGEPRAKKVKGAVAAPAAEKGKDGAEGQESNAAVAVGEEVSANGDGEGEKSV
ncbi:hypothetical protein BDN70DRAFT_666852 [Pholiota conissans]|uniref:Zn(2)-C6 fungal-type domain-containing protein n=1 Tax=Pholiota conissans TaxID=109636 RepID=A0A9P5Z3V6_9AGAR|nr:hypothetical protein BDN70DRAFT_666852 [Pholiota conissans]